MYVCQFYVSSPRFCPRYYVLAFFPHMPTGIGVVRIDQISPFHQIIEKSRYGNMGEWEIERKKSTTHPVSCLNQVLVESPPSVAAGLKSLILMKIFACFLCEIISILFHFLVNYECLIKI